MSCKQTSLGGGPYISSTAIMKPTDWLVQCVLLESETVDTVVKLQLFAFTGYIRIRYGTHVRLWRYMYRFITLMSLVKAPFISS